MKRITSILILFVLALSNIYAGQLVKPTDRAIDGLVGLVMRIEEDVAEIKIEGGKLTEGSRRRSRLVIYDRQGRMTRRWSNVTGASSTDQSFSYDESGARHIRSKIFNPLLNRNPNSSNEELGLQTFRFDATENALHEDVYVGDRPIPNARTQRRVYRFDAAGRLSERILYTLRGMVSVRDVYIYGTDRHPTERQLYGFGSPQPQTIKYIYTLDSRGNWIKRVEENTLANPEGTQRNKVTYRKLSYY